jgi:hypothetical protein
MEPWYGAKTDVGDRSRKVFWNTVVFFGAVLIGGVFTKLFIYRVEIDLYGLCELHDQQWACEWYQDWLGKEVK